jgi:hypothetical protein
MPTNPPFARRCAPSLFPAAPVSIAFRRSFALTTCLALISGAACSPSLPTPGPSAGASAAAIASSTPESPRPTRIEHVGYSPIETGEPIVIASLFGRIVFDDFENVSAMDVDGSNLVTVADTAGPEFDGAWSPDGRWIVYRDSTRGINNDDEVYIAAADGSSKRDLTDDPADDWGPDWSHDGTTIAFMTTSLRAVGTTPIRWPELPWREWEPTHSTLHMWLQIVGKVRLALAPPLNHWWHVPLYVTSRGLTTSPVPYGDREFQVDFDFVEHRLNVTDDDPGSFTMSLEAR